MRINLSVVFAVAALAPVAALAEDSITCPPSDNRAEATCIVVPEKDGVFQFEFRAEANGNGHGTPSIWTQIALDNVPDKDKECAKKKTIAWKNNAGGATAICAKPLKAGQAYTVVATTGNENADSTSAVLKTKRVGK